MSPGKDSGKLSELVLALAFKATVIIIFDKRSPGEPLYSKRVLRHDHSMMMLIMCPAEKQVSGKVKVVLTTQINSRLKKYFKK